MADQIKGPKDSIENDDTNLFTGSTARIQQYKSELTILKIQLLATRFFGLIGMNRAIGVGSARKQEIGGLVAWLRNGGGLIMFVCGIEAPVKHATSMSVALRRKRQDRYHQTAEIKELLLLYASRLSSVLVRDHST